eukprot:jgi/Pico_ML_1/54432/g4778.t1
MSPSCMSSSPSLSTSKAARPPFFFPFFPFFSFFFFVSTASPPSAGSSEAPFPSSPSKRYSSSSTNPLFRDLRPILSAAERSTSAAAHVEMPMEARSSGTPFPA